MKHGILQILKTSILLPYYGIQVLSGVKSFRDNPVLGSQALNRRGLHSWRVVCAARLTAQRREKLRHLVPEVERRFFEEHGYIERSDFLPPDEFRKLVAEVEDLAAPAREMTEGSTITRRMPVPPGVLRDAPAIRAFLCDRRWSDMVRYVGGFDVEPVVTIQTIMATPPRTMRERDPQTRLHIDTFHSTVKAWLFLHDVRKDEGPLLYVPGSHRITKRRLAWHKRMSVVASRGGTGGAFRITAGALKTLRLPEPRKFAVPANTLVIADTFGFHARGHSAKPSVRVEFFASQRVNPFIPFVGLDTARLPFVSGRKQTIAWRFQDFMHRIGLMKPTMRPVGRIRPRQKRSVDGMPEDRIVRGTPETGTEHGR